jgi:Flp pilus assembly pilin Flp
MAVRGFLCRLVSDDKGQDLIEYALLCTFIGLAGVGVFGLICQAIATTYGSWNTSTNTIWQTPPPAGS